MPMGESLYVQQFPKKQEEIEDMARVVGSIMYAMVCTRPYISHAVGVLSRYMSTPRKEHWIVVKRVFKYFSVMKDYVICYQGKLVGENGKLNVHGFVDVD
jgi:hypothetical protein